MVRKIPEPLRQHLQEIGEVGGHATYLVGGFVRDLLLGRPSLDIDIVVEGDAIQVAKAMQHRWGGTLHVHSKFGTATVTPSTPAYPKVDFVMARRETYDRPGTLPTVEAGTIVDDLQRRDFSINALAMRLGTDVFGTIVDETGGLSDLEAGVIRVLHEQSFLDDPTRIFRAFRYAGRYRFQLAAGDADHIRNALPILAQLSGERIRNEIARVLMEENAPQIVEKLTQFGIFETISIGWQIDTAFAHEFRTAQHTLTWASQHLADEPFQPDLVRWMALFGKTVPTYQIEALSFRLVLEHQLRRLVSRSEALQRGVSLDKVTHSAFETLGFPLSQHVSVAYQNGKWYSVDSGNRTTYVCGDGNLYQVQTPLTAYRELVQSFASVKPEAKPSEIYQLLKPYPLEALAFTYVDTARPAWQREKIGDYLFRLRKIHPLITGEDLIALGEKPGTTFETRLWELFAAQLDGEITTKSEAVCRVREAKGDTMQTQ